MKIASKIKTLTLISVTSLTLMACAGQMRQDAATFDRDQEVYRILAEMDEIGFVKNQNGVQISPGVDQVLNAVNAIALRKHAVIVDYRSRAENFPDVSAFMTGRSADDPEAIAAAIREFDALYPAEPIGPKVDAYEAAGAQIYAANVTLAAEIAAEVVTLGVLLSNNASAVAQAAAGSGVSSLMGRMQGSGSGSNAAQDADTDLGAALVRARHQLRLAGEASALIQEDKRLMDELLAQEQRFQSATN